MPFDEALRCIQADSGSHFDPSCVAAFTATWSAILAVRETAAGSHFAAMAQTTEPWARVPELRCEVEMTT